MWYQITREGRCRYETTVRASLAKRKPYTRQMNQESDTENVSRRSVLQKTAIASGAALIGGATLAGEAAGSPKTNFAYVSEDVGVGDRVTLEERGDRPNLNCNDAGANIRTTEWDVSGDDDSWYFIPNGYKGGETVEVTGEAVGCESTELADKEVQVTQV